MVFGEGLSGVHAGYMIVSVRVFSPVLPAGTALDVVVGKTAPPVHQSLAACTFLSALRSLACLAPLVIACTWLMLVAT